jgi:DNA-binding CsgD family transcriptional regulator
MTKGETAMTEPATSTAARIVVGLAVADPQLAQRLRALVAGDTHLHMGDATRPADVVLTDRPQDGGPPSVLIDADAHAAGARAVLPPTVGAELLRATITVVAAGYTLIGPDEPPGLADEIVRPDALPPGEPLTEREKQVLALVAHGASNKAIARDLGISVHTAKFHVASLLAKLGARNRSDAVAIGIRRGVVMA